MIFFILPSIINSPVINLIISIIFVISSIVLICLCISGLHMCYRFKLLDSKLIFNKELIKLLKKEKTIKVKEGEDNFILMYKEVTRLYNHFNGTEPVLRKRDEFAWDLLNKYKIRNVKYRNLSVISNNKD